MEENIKNWYDRNYKLLLVIPAILLLVSIVYLFVFVQRTGDIIYKDVSLTGGTTISVFDKQVKEEDVEIALKESFPDIRGRGITNFRTGEQEGFFVESKAEVDDLKNALEDFLGYKLNQDNSSIEFSGAGISEGFYKQIQTAIIFAFVFMAIVVFLVFRTFVPSFAVVLSAFADIVMSIALVNFLGIELSMAGIIAFLMLIGYSVDTDILLTSRLVKSREGSVNNRLYEAFKTGMTMTLTSIAAVSVAFLIIYNFSDTLRQIFGILLIGLGFDIINTWFANAGILKMYVEKKNSGGKLK